MSADEIPQFFLMRVTDEHGTYYVVCQSLVAVAEGSMPEAIEASVNQQISLARDRLRVEACEIPRPNDDGSTWMALSSKIQVKPRG